MKKYFNLKRKIFTWLGQRGILNRIPEVFFYFGPPRIIHLELSTFCNLHCIGCPCNEIPRGEKQFFDKEAISSRAKDIARYCPDAKIYLFNHGDSLLHPQLVSIIEELHSYGLNNLYLDTNFAMSLTSEEIKALYQAGIKELVISIDGTNQEQVEAFRQGIIYSQLIANMNLLSIIQASLPSTTKIIIQTVVGTHNQHSTLQIRELASSLGFNNFRERPLSLKPSMVQLQQGMPDIEMLPIHPCVFGFWGMTISAANEYLICCNSRKTYDSNFSKWRAKEMNSMRKKILCRKFQDCLHCQIATTSYQIANPKEQ